MIVRGSGRRFGDDTGAGGVLAIAIVGATMVATIGILTLGAALVTRQGVAAAADAAALAAADAMLGAVPGEPCTLAAEVALANTASLVACRIDGAEVYVTAQAAFAGIPVAVSARAGPRR